MTLTPPITTHLHAATTHSVATGSHPLTGPRKPKAQTPQGHTQDPFCLAALTPTSGGLFGNSSPCHISLCASLPSLSYRSRPKKLAGGSSGVPRASSWNRNCFSKHRSSNLAQDSGITLGCPPTTRGSAG